MWICRLLHVANKTYMFDKNIFGLKYNVVRTDSVVQMISALIKEMFCLLNFPNNFLRTVKIARIKIFLKVNGLQVNIIQILSRITAKTKFMFELPLILTEIIIK